MNNAKVFKNCSILFNDNKYSHEKERFCSWISIWFLGEFNDIFIEGLTPESFDEFANGLNAFMERINIVARERMKYEFQNKMRQLIGV